MEIGSQGKLGGYIKLRGTEGVWKDLIDHFNTLARNTTSQVRALSEVTGSIARGDLSKIINLDLQGTVKDVSSSSFFCYILSFCQFVLLSSLVCTHSYHTRSLALLTSNPFLGESLELKNIVNCMVAQLTLLTSEVSRVTREVGVDGILGAQISMPGLQGVWEMLVAGLNTMITNLTSQIRAISEIVTAFLQVWLSLAKVFCLDFALTIMTVTIG